MEIPASILQAEADRDCADFFCVPGEHWWRLHSNSPEISERDWRMPCPDHDPAERVNA